MHEVQEPWVWSLGWEDPLEGEMAAHSSISPRIIQWAEEPGGLQSVDRRVRHNWVIAHNNEMEIVKMYILQNQGKDHSNRLSLLIGKIFPFGEKEPGSSFSMNYPYKMLKTPWSISSVKNHFGYIVCYIFCRSQCKNKSAEPLVKNV